MKISSQLKRGIYEVSFGYHSKLDGYATLMSDIQELSDIAGRRYINDVWDTLCVFIRRNTYEFLR